MGGYVEQYLISKILISMMKVLLDSLIRKLIISEYPFIKDFEIKLDTFKPKIGKFRKIGVERYTIIYNVTPDENGEYPYDDEFKEITELTETCFNALGPADYQRVKDVEFYGYED